jgi:hypothetical protein
MSIFVEIAIGYPHPNGYPDADRPSLVEAPDPITKKYKLA